VRQVEVLPTGGWIGAKKNASNKASFFGTEKRSENSSIGLILSVQ